MSLPNFLMVGAARCGTTSLYYYLKQHPEIGFPSLKEPRYFSSLHAVLPHEGPGDASVDRYIIRTRWQYEDLFARLAKYPRVGEASPEYLYYWRHTPGEIRATLGDIPILIILRDPVARAFSAYQFLVRDSRETLSFRQGLQAEDQRLEENWHFMWAYKRAGLYFRQVEAYCSAFSQVKVVLLDDLRVRPVRLLQDIFRFLGVDDTFVADTTIPHNPSGRPRHWMARLILRRDNQVTSSFRELLKRFVPRALLEAVSRRWLTPMECQQADVGYLKRFFAHDIKCLSRLIERDLTSWLAKGDGVVRVCESGAGDLAGGSASSAVNRAEG